MHEMKIDTQSFDGIKQGIKKIEVRLFDKKRKKLHIDDTITFTNRDDKKQSLQVRITGLLYYPTFNGLFADLHERYFADYKREELENSMYKHYEVEDEMNYGVVGIRVELL